MHVSNSCDDDILQNDENTYGFETPSRPACKHLYKCSMEHHSFFRLVQVSPNPPDVISTRFSRYDAMIIYVFFYNLIMHITVCRPCAGGLCETIQQSSRCDVSLQGFYTLNKCVLHNNITMVASGGCSTDYIKPGDAFRNLPIARINRSANWPRTTI